MRRQNHLQKLEQKAIEENYRAYKQNEREESVAATRRGGSTHTDTMRERARESKAKKGFESGLLKLHGVPSQP